MRILKSIIHTFLIFMVVIFSFALFTGVIETLIREDKISVETNKNITYSDTIQVLTNDGVQLNIDVYLVYNSGHIFKTKDIEIKYIVFKNYTEISNKYNSFDFTFNFNNINNEVFECIKKDMEQYGISLVLLESKVI